MAEPRCPACGSAAASVEWRASADEAAQHFVLREADPERHRALRHHIAALWRGEVCDVVRCRSCGFGFARPFVAGDERFYTLAYAEPGYPRDRWEYGRTLQALRRRPVADQGRGCALEIGAGKGVFLDAAVAAGVIEGRGVTTIEHNPAARAALAQKGYRTLAGDIRDIDLPGGAFDAVFMFQVLEHLDRVDALFARLAAITAEDAALFISVPNTTRTDFNERHGGLLDMPPNHIGQWTLKALATLAGRHGFIIADVDHEPCGLRHFAQEDAVARYLRLAQRRGSLANRVRSRPRSAVRRAAEVATVAGIALSRPPVWAKVWRQRSALGGALWAELVKRSPPAAAPENR